MEWEGCGGALAGGKCRGNSVRNPLFIVWDAGVGGGVECYHHATELSSAYSTGYSLELQKQENMAVTKRSTHIGSLGVYSSVRKTRNIY